MEVLLVVAEASSLWRPPDSVHLTLRGKQKDFERNFGSFDALSNRC
jgi:hypothetical protein